MLTKGSHRTFKLFFFFARPIVDNVIISFKICSYIKPKICSVRIEIVIKCDCLIVFYTNGNRIIYS